MKGYGETMKNQATHPESSDQFAGQQSAARHVQVCYLPYRWARIPAVVLGFVGAACAASHHWRGLAGALSFVNIPAEWSCYLIVAGAGVLFGLSLIRTRSQSDVIVSESFGDRTRPAWRSI